MKEAAYKGMVRPILEYGSSVWDPHPDKLQEGLEMVQNRAARFVTRNYCVTLITLKKSLLLVLLFQWHFVRSLCL